MSVGSNNPFDAIDNLVALLHHRSNATPNHVAYHFLSDGDSADKHITYATLHHKAQAIGAWLQTRHTTGERALLLFPPGLDYIAAYLGCLYAGIIAVPAYTPRLNRPSPRIKGIVQDSGATIALADSQVINAGSRRSMHDPELDALDWFNVDKVPENIAATYQLPSITDETTAFLQYTSGSTGTPKGVIVSHGNLVHNLRAIQHGFGIPETSCGVFWLPMYHDMGLIGGVLEPLYSGVPSYLMAPAAFLQKPVRWLQAISRYGGTISGAPNFAYKMCVEKISDEQLRGLDLSGWRLAFCGAEPIRPNVLHQFAKRFASVGFNASAFYPCYGMAENTLIASGGIGPAPLKTITISRQGLTRDQATIPVDTTDALDVVSCGNGLHDQIAITVDPETSILSADNHVGEIWIRGGSVAQGYWNRPELTQTTFYATTSAGEHPFLRTGDLGFIQDGDLYITGRLKDLIIIRGRNYYPQDIELTVEHSHSAFEPGMGAAFSITAGDEEQLVVVYELRRQQRKADVKEVTEAAREAVARTHGIQPTAIVLLRPLSIPKTSSGKIRRAACRAAFDAGSLREIGRYEINTTAIIPSEPVSIPRTLTREALTNQLSALVASQLKRDSLSIDPSRPLVDYGLDSVQIVELAGQLEAIIGRNLPPTLLWDYPTIDALASHLAEQDPRVATSPPPSIAPSPSPNEPIAIIGLGCRFPGADGPDAFWQLLHDGIDAISEVPPERWDVDALFSAESATPGKMNTRWGGFLDGVDQFDPQFFGISPREAARIDPQQRLLLETAWQALENAAIPPDQLAGTATGVFIGISSYDYARLQYSDPQLIDAYAGTGNAHSIAANRLSYLFDLRGPSLAIDTACSSSLVAIHQAVRSLRHGESTLALVGGVNLILQPEMTITFSQARMMASDGRCKTFDADADGYVRGEGCGVVVLKRLSDAEQDGDRILAVVRGSAVNQDGRSNGLTAPNGLAQQAVIRQAWADAGVNSAEIDAIEAHGTGTPLGDPIEVNALKSVLDDGASQPVHLGAVKTNIGHLEAAAGIAGVIKVVLSLQHATMPPNLHLQAINPYIDLTASRLTLPTTSKPWPRSKRTRIAGVSSFGFGGTNAHVVVTEPPLPTPTELAEVAPVELQRSRHLLTLSARSEPALRQLAANYADFLAENDVVTADVAYTTNVGRQHFDVRVAVSAKNTSEFITNLYAIANGQTPLATTQRKAPSIAFLFTGQGSQRSGMGQTLYATSPIFRDALDHCAVILEPDLPLALTDILFDPAHAELLDQTQYTQPALFAIEYALAQLWQSWGVAPTVVLGHSVGEFVAATIAGSLTLEQGLRLIAARARLMQALPDGGAMAAIFAAEEVVRKTLGDYAQVAVAAFNAPENTVISGPQSDIDSLLARFAKRGIKAQALTVSHAFHSSLMEPMLDEFEAISAEITAQQPRIPLISNVTGQLKTTAPDARYWRNHVRQPVRYMDSVREAARHADILIEIGPGTTLLSLGQRSIANTDKQWLPSLRNKRDDWQVLLDTLGKLYEAGLDIEWSGFDVPHTRHKLALPTYPFDRQRYWLDISPSATPLPVINRAANGVLRRLPTAVPIFEATVDTISAETILPLLKQAADTLDLSIAEFALTEAIIAPTTIQFIFHNTTCTLHTRQPNGDWYQLTTATITPSPHHSVTPSPSHPVIPPSPLVVLHYAIARIMGISAEKIDPKRPLDTLGLDSLMAIELRGAIEQALGVTLPVVAFLQGPTIEELAVEIERYLAQPAQQAPPIVAVTDSAEAQPLTVQQQALWFLHELLPPDLSFNVSGAVRVHGTVDEDAMRRALQQLVNRHPALRTIFTSGDDGQPLQRILPTAPAPFTAIEATDWPESRVQQIVREHAYAPFDLTVEPALRVLFLRRGATNGILLVALDHIITDFWSMSILVQELGALYAAERSGERIVLPTTVLRPADVAHWQRDLLDGEIGRTLRNFWLEQLNGALPLLDLPTDRPRPAVQEFAGDTVEKRFSAELSAKLRALAQQEGTTLATLLLAAFQTFLHRLTQQDDLITGSVVAGRDRPELAPVVGYFVNPVALRADFSAAPTFVDFLVQAKQTLLNAYAHQDYPLALLADALQIERDPARPPLFETLFIMQQAQQMADQGWAAFALGLPDATLTVADLELESLAIPGMPAQFDLTLMAADTATGLAATFHYSTALFDASTMERWLDNFAMLLESIVAHPQSPVSELRLITDYESEQLAQWNATEQSLPAVGIYELVATQASRTPDAIAVSDASTAISYAELIQHSDALAAHLQQQGTQPGDFVGVMVGRSAEMPIILLAILQCGGVYIPLDPDFPASRLALMLEDAQPALLITDASTANTASELAYTGKTLELPTQSPHHPVTQSPSHPITPSPPHPLAYLIYTSGSTGKPKGVQVTQQGVVNFLLSMAREPGFSAEDIIPAVTTLSFDIAVLELFLPLITGGQTHIVSRAVAADGAQLIDAIRRSSATIMQATPATWRMLLAVGWQGGDLQRILSGGEALPRDLADALLARCDAVWNMYGPTETTIWSTIQRVTAGDGPVSIGKPIANTTIHVLDDLMQPVPIGVDGDLYIGGAGVAQGYWHRPKLTSERFVQPALYKTGDRARWQPDGTLLFLGRSDFQVKVRGYRIELGDVEIAMAQHPAIAQAVVAAHATTTGDNRLIAYLLLEPNAAKPATSDLRAFLAQQLPDYMLPAAFVVLDSLPLTPNNKVDRRALPAPDSAEIIPSSTPFVAPRTPTETIIAAIWADALQIKRVGIYDDFFELGGNSLLATRLITQTRLQFNATLPLRTLFANPTVAGLAHALDTNQSPNSSRSNGQADYVHTQQAEVSRAELSAAATLDPTITAGDLTFDRHAPLHNVLLTGATGFVGAFLLRDLLNHTNATITCLVRAGDADVGFGRLQKNLAQYGIWDDAFGARIVVVPGDLGLRRLGISAETHAHLAQTIDTIVHNGALVNFIYPFSKHKAANVTGTQEILRLAATATLKPVHFVSTLSIFHAGQHDDGSVFHENTDLDTIDMPYGGYAQSKWVAEKLMLAARERGIPTTIYRPGLVSGASDTGAWNSADMMTTLAQTCMLLRAVPDLAVAVDLVPVDYVSQAIVTMAQQSETAHNTFHLANPQPARYNDLLVFLKAQGIVFETIPFVAWRKRVVDLAQQYGMDNPYLSLLEEVSAEQIFMPAIDCSNTLQALRNTEIACPPVDSRLLTTYLQHLQGTRSE